MMRQRWTEPDVSRYQKHHDSIHYATYFVMLMLSVANFLNNGMDQYFVFQNAFNKSTIQVLDLYVYNIGMTGRSLSLATAIGILKSIVSVTLLAIVNFVSKKTRGESMI